jgi:hypothetical protein
LALAHRLLLEVQKDGEPQEILLRKVGDQWEVVDPKDPKADEIRRLPPVRLRLADMKASPIIKKYVPPPAGQQPPGNADRRLDELEKKLAKILEQVELMQNRMK